MPRLLQQIDDLVRHEHWFISADHDCRFIGEYLSQGTYRDSKTNDFIKNLKIKPSEILANPLRLRYKNRATEEAAVQLAETLPGNLISRATFVPIPSSKVEGHPEYDPRMARVLERLSAKLPQLDWKALLVQTVSLQADHENPDRTEIEELIAAYSVDENLACPEPAHIVIVDDVLTNGRHFVAARNVLTSRFPNVEVTGIFLARRTWPTAAAPAIVNI